MAEETEASKIAAKNIYPVVAVEAGYNLYLADNCEDPELHKSARIAAKNFNKMMNSFPEKSAEGLYCLNLRMAANSLARGITTRKHILNKKIAAAEAMCDWGEEKEGLSVLVEALKDKTDKARLYAAIVLSRIGEKARPALDQIRAGLKDRDNYVQRVTQATLKQLESR